jgi:Helix-turn-helix domain
MLSPATPQIGISEERMLVQAHVIESPDDLLLIDEVSELTRRPVATLRWLRHRGEGPVASRMGRRIYYRRQAVMAWLAEQERGESSPQPAA